MSAACFLAAAIILACVALGVTIHNGTIWAAMLVALGLFLWVVGAPGWTWPRRTR